MEILSKEKLIQIFTKEKEITPQYGMFGSDKHEILDEMIFVLDNNLDMDGVYDLELDSEVEMNVLGIFEYLDGSTDLEDILYEDISNYEDIINGVEDSSCDVVVCKKMCGDCPFSKTSLKGFLPGYTMEDFINFQKYSVAFPCHKMMNENGLSVDETEKAIKSGQMKFCRGYVESIIKSAKRPDNKLLQKAVDFVREDGLSDNSMSIFEFVEFHKIGENIK